MGKAIRHSRRSFLSGKAATAAIGDAIRDAGDEPHPQEHHNDAADASQAASQQAPAAVYHLRVKRRAMACEFEIQFEASPEAAVTQHALAALDLVEAIESQLTVYRDHSEVQHINLTAARQPVPVEPRLFELLQAALHLCHETAGALDVTSGPLSEVWGFSRRAGRLPADGEIAAALERIGYRHVELDAAAGTIAFARPDVQINLNAIGKGYALDRQAEFLTTRLMENFLLHGGRSSVSARGRNAADRRGGWTVGIRDPLRPQQRLAEFTLRNEALATSGSATQHFRHEGRRYGHILDPRTGRPAEGIYSATAIAPTAAEADALSTAFYVMGPAETETFCQSHPQYRALLVCPAAREGTVNVVPCGLSEEDWQRC